MPTKAEGEDLPGQVGALPRGAGEEGATRPEEVEIVSGSEESEWLRLRERLDSGEVLEAEVVGFNRGGLLADLGNKRGFVPASLLVGIPRGLSQEQLLADLGSRVGQKLRLKIVELDEANNRVILSQRAVFPNKSRVEQVLEMLNEGQIRRGRVSSISNFGVFVDLGGIDGLVHISEMAWGRVAQPTDLVQIGDIVEVYVLGVDREHKRVALSMKQLRPDPWTTVEEKYQVEQVVEGLVTSVVDFGAFVRIEDGLEGLIHISELTDGGYVSHPSEVVQVGDMVQARIIRIESERRRLGLSLRGV